MTPLLWILLALAGDDPPSMSVVGAVAPPVRAINGDGNGDIGSYYHERFVLVAFWSLRDPRSLEQFEKLKELRRDLAEANRLLIVSVCTDELDEDNWEDWMRFLKAEGEVQYGDQDRKGRFAFYMDHKWVNAMQDTSNGRSTEDYDVKSVPDAFLIGPDGRFRAVHVATESLRQTVKEAMDKGK